MIKYATWTKLRVVLSNSEMDNAMATIEEGTTAESQYHSAKNLGQKRGSSVALNWSR